MLNLLEVRLPKAPSNSLEQPALAEPTNFGEHWVSKHNPSAIANLANV